MPNVTIKENNIEVFKAETSDFEEMKQEFLCTECWDPDCESCND